MCWSSRCVAERREESVKRLRTLCTLWPANSLLYINSKRKSLVSALPGTQRRHALGLCGSSSHPHTARCTCTELVLFSNFIYFFVHFFIAQHVACLCSLCNTACAPSLRISFWITCNRLIFSDIPFGYFTSPKLQSISTVCDSCSVMQHYQSVLS